MARRQVTSRPHTGIDATTNSASLESELGVTHACLFAFHWQATGPSFKLTDDAKAGDGATRAWVGGIVGIDPTLQPDGRGTWSRYRRPGALVVVRFSGPGTCNASGGRDRGAAGSHVPGSRGAALRQSRARLERAGACQAPSREGSESRRNPQPLTLAQRGEGQPVLCDPAWQ
eukprot:2661619-Rhodomonas_salina.1